MVGNVGGDLRRLGAVAAPLLMSNGRCFSFLLCHLSYAAVNIRRTPTTGVITNGTMVGAAAGVALA